MVRQYVLTLPPKPRGCHLITRDILEEVELPAFGLMHVFIRHTSAGLTLNENADPTARRDFATGLDRLAPDGADWMTHTSEGPDDMPAHIKGALTAVQVSVPVIEGKLALGVWQGVFLWEHRHSARARSVIVNVLGDAQAT